MSFKGLTPFLFFILIVGEEILNLSYLMRERWIMEGAELLYLLVFKGKITQGAVMMGCPRQKIKSVCSLYFF